MNWGEVNPVHAYYNGSCTSKDTEDPSWSTSFKTRRTRKTSSALEALWKTLFVLHLYLIGTLLGNGDSTLLWDDPWHVEGILKDRFPRVYALETFKSVTVGDKLAHPSLSHSFRRMPRGGAELSQFVEFTEMMQQVILAPVSDRWTWTLNNSGEFSVASVRKLIDDKVCTGGNQITRWIRYVPNKVNIHAWKVMTNSLATKFNISRRGIDIDSISCVNCGIGVETTSHLFFTCEMAQQVSHLINLWWDVPDIEIDSYDSWKVWVGNIRLISKTKMMFEGVYHVSWWLLWWYRNQKIFEAKTPNKALLFDDCSDSRYKITKDMTLRILRFFKRLGIYATCLLYIDIQSLCAATNVAEDVSRFLEYVPRFREVEVYIETTVSMVERHMMKRMTSNGKGVMIEEIVDHDFNNVFPSPWSTEIMIANRTKRLSNEFDFKQLLTEINHEFGLENSIDEPEELEEISDIFAEHDQALNELDQVTEVEEPEEIINFEHVVSDGGVILGELYDVIVAQKGGFSADDGDVIPDEMVADVVAEKRVGPVDDGNVISDGVVAEEMLEDQTRSIKRRRVMSDNENEDDA
ncbi:RNA-directed DNA polymerase, eukaryota, reverse transcriptase zinc-binding domain protein [Tanacetum coccineum]